MAMREIWSMRLSLMKRGGNELIALWKIVFVQPTIFILLKREQTGEFLDGLGDWWTKYQDANEDEAPSYGARDQFSSTSKSQTAKKIQRLSQCIRLLSVLAAT